MAIEIVRFSQLSEEAKLLFSGEHVGFFSSVMWYQNWLDTVLLQKNEQAVFLNYTKSQQLKLLLPVKINNSCLDSLANYYSPLFHLLSSTDIEQESCLQDFFSELKNLPLSWDRITLRAMKQEHVFLLLPLLKGVGIPAIPFYCFANWYLEVNQRSFDEYFSGLASRVKNTVTRKTKKFNRLDGARVEIVVEGQALEKGIKAFESVYSLSWKGDETYPEFISGLMKIASRQGGLRLGLAYLNDEAVAAQLWIVADNTAYIYKLAYDEKYKKLSIGSILTATLMRHVVDVDKVDYVDYLSGDDAYKKEWMSHRRERWGIMIFNWRTGKGCLKMINEFTRFYFKKCFFK